MRKLQVSFSAEIIVLSVLLVRISRDRFSNAQFDINLR